jgi:ketosteroid isomerase-like protein
MNDNFSIIKSFTKAIEQKDITQLALSYSPDIIFFDPLFGLLKNDFVFNMWKFRFDNYINMKIEWGSIEDIGDDYFTVQWKLEFDSNETGRPVILKVKSHLRIINDKIAEQSDAYRLHQLLEQEYGIAGKLLGWNRLYQNRIKLNISKKLINNY